MIKILSYKEFKKISKQKLIIIIAKTKNCSACIPITNKLNLFMENYSSIPMYEIYLEDVEIFQGQHLVFSVPTILVFSDGTELLRESRFIDFQKIERLFNIYLER